MSHPLSQPPIISPDLLLTAYRAGVFPMADSRDDREVFWVEPRQRGILPLDHFHCSHSLARTLRRGHFRVTCDAAFDAVVDACAAPRPSEHGETWISHRIAASYRRLNQLGHAHSIEVWQESEGGAPERLVGGLYGVGFARVFCGESMFSRVPDASKVALAWLVAALRLGGARLLDCQFITPHLASLGAVEIEQAAYLKLLAEAGQEAPHHQAERAASHSYWPLSSFGTATSPPVEAAAEAVAAGAPLSLPDAFAALLEAAKSAGFSSSPGNFIAQSLTQTS